MIWNPAGSPSSSARPLGRDIAGDAGEVGRDGRDVVEVHRHRVVELVAEPERGRRRGRADEHVCGLEGAGEVVGDEAADLLGRAVVGVVVAAGQGVGAEDDPALDLVAEAGVPGRGHDLLGAGVVDPLGQHPQAVAHGVELGQVARRLAGQDEVVGGERVGEARGGHLDDLGSRGDQVLDRLLEAPLDAWLEALAGQLLDDADPHAGDVGPGRGLDDRRDGGVDRRRVHRVVSADDAVQQCRVEDRPGDRSGLVEGGGQGDQAVTGHAAVGRLRPDRPGDRGRLADGAAGVGADRERRLEGGDDGGRPAAGAARDAVEVPRVVGRAVGRVLRRRAHGELVHVGLAEDRHARLADPPHEGGVVGRHPALEDPAPARRRQTPGRQDVLDRDGDPGHDMQLLTAGAPLVGVPRRREGALGVEVQVAVDEAVDGSGPVEVGLDHLDGRGLAGGDEVGQLGGAGSGEVGAHGVVVLGVVAGSGASGVCRRLGWVRGSGAWSVFVEDPRDREPLLVRLGRAAERVLGAERGADLVGTGDVDQGQGVRHRLDVGDRRLLDRGHRLQDDAQLADHAVELGVGEVDAGEAGEVGHVRTGEVSHAGQSMGGPRKGPDGVTIRKPRSRAGGQPAARMGSVISRSCSSGREGVMPLLASTSW